MNNYKEAMAAVSAEKFFQAKILEFEGACCVDDPGRIKVAEENCQHALQGWLDAKAAQIKSGINEFKRNNR